MNKQCYGIIATIICGCCGANVVYYVVFQYYNVHICFYIDLWEEFKLGLMNQDQKGLEFDPYCWLCLEVSRKNFSHSMLLHMITHQ